MCIINCLMKSLPIKLIQGNWQKDKLQKNTKLYGLAK